MYKTIAFDLDDTLVDTTGLLATKASRAAFEHLIQNGLNLSLAECEIKRIELIRSVSHREVFEILAKNFGNEQTVNACQQASKFFYHPDLPKHLPCLPYATENLEYLKNKYTLYLVTAGFEEAQNKKVDSLGIRHFFKKIYVVDSLSKKRKRESFEDIINSEKIQPAELFCIGNSMSSEIADALSIGATACFFDFGEDRGQADSIKHLKPHFHIKGHTELVRVCKL